MSYRITKRYIEFAEGRYTGLPAGGISMKDGRCCVYVVTFGGFAAFHGLITSAPATRQDGFADETEEVA